MSWVRTVGLCSLLPLFLTGCDGTTTFCFVSTLGASPQSAIVVVGSSQKFVASGTTTLACTFQSDPATSVVWSVSDSVNVSISNSPGASFGTATCLGATGGPVAVTATLGAEKNGGKQVAASSTLTCE